MKRLAKTFPGRFFITVENSLIYFQELAKIKTHNWLSEDPERKIIGVTGLTEKRLTKRCYSGC